MKRWKVGAIGAAAVLASVGISVTPASAASTPFVTQFGTNFTDGVGGVAVSSGGNVYAGGTTFGKFPGQKKVAQSDAFLTKMNSKGKILWIREFGTAGKENVTGIAISSSGYIYVTGTTDGVFPKQISVGGTDGFLAKYSSGGTKLWVKQFGTAGADFPRGVAISSSGRVYITGMTSGAFPFYVNAGGGADGFLLRYTSGGTPVWAVQLGTVAYDELAGVTVSSAGDVFVTGQTEGAFPTFANAGDSDGVVAKYNSSGLQLWLTQFGTSSFDHSLGVAVTKTGELYLGGYTGGALPTQANSGLADGFIARYDAATGVNTWFRQIGTAADDDVAGVALTKTGYILIGGSTYGAFPTKVNAGGSDMYTATVDAAGVLQELFQVGTSADESVSGVAAAKSSDPILGGGTKGAFPTFLNAGAADAVVMDIESGLPEST